MNKSTWVALVVFAALAVAAVLTLREKPERGITRVSFSQVDPERVDRLVIKGKDEVELHKEGGVWKVGDKRADGDAVQRLLEVVAGASSSELETNNSERYAEMEVGGDKGVAVDIYGNGKKVASFVIGGAGPAGSHVRIDDAVYAVRGLYRATFARDASGWVEKRLFFTAPNEVDRVEVTLTGEVPYALVKDGGAWKLEDPSKLSEGHRFDATAAAALARSLVAARAGEVLDSDPGEAAGLSGAADTLRFTDEDGTQHTLTLGAAQDDGSVYARSSDREVVVTLRKSTADSLRKRVGDLRDLTLMAIDPNAVQKLEIASADGSVVFDKEAEGWSLASSSDPPGNEFVLDETSVRRRVAQLARAKAVAEAAADIPDVTQLETSPQHVSVTLSDGSTAVLRFGPETKWQDQDVVLARGNAEGGVFLVRKGTRDQLLGLLETFRRRDDADSNPLGNIDPQTLQNLPPEVRESLLKQLQEKAQRDALMKKALESQP